MKWRGSTTGILLMCSAGVACLVGAGLFAAKQFSPSDPINEQTPTGPNVSLVKYENLTKGMEFDVVSKMLGREGTLKSTCTIELKNGRQVETNLYLYENADGSNCMLMFQDQILRVKTQSGLQ